MASRTDSDADSDAAPDGVLEHHLSSPAMLLAHVGVDAMNRLRASLVETDLTPKQFEVLGLLSDRGPTGQQELLAAVQVAASVLVTVLNPLERDRLVVRERDQSDRRRHVVVLTDAGRERLEQASDDMSSVQARMFSMLDAQQLGQLTALLGQIRDGLISGQGADRSMQSLKQAAVAASASPHTA